MSLPVFTAGSAGGRSYKQDVPMSYNSASAFLRTTAAACGYGGKLIYNVRRHQVLITMHRHGQEQHDVRNAPRGGATPSRNLGRTGYANVLQSLPGVKHTPKCLQSESSVDRCRHICISTDPGHCTRVGLSRFAFPLQIQ